MALLGLQYSTAFEDNLTKGVKFHPREHPFFHLRQNRPWHHSMAHAIQQEPYLGHYRRTFLFHLGYVLISSCSPIHSPVVSNLTCLHRSRFAGYFVLLIWLPTYFNQQLGFDLAASSFLSILPWFAMFVSANAGGLIADNMRARGLSITAVRKTMQTIGFLGPALCLTFVGTTTDPALAVVYMTSALALGSFSQSGVYSNHQDIGPAYSGILLGIRYVSSGASLVFHLESSF